LEGAESKIVIKVNLVRRGVVVKNIFCCLCGLKEESTNHMFFGCRIAWLVWNLCYTWLGVMSVAPHDSFSHLLQFNTSNASKYVNLVLESVWISVVREIWSHRNKVIFNDRVVNHSEIFSLAQLKAWSWVTSKVPYACFSYSDWCLAPWFVWIHFCLYAFILGWWVVVFRLGVLIGLCDVYPWDNIGI